MITKKQAMSHPFLKRLRSSWTSRSPFLLYAVRSALATGISWAIVFPWLGTEAAALAVASAVIVVQITGWQTIRKSIERVVAVIIGVGLAMLVARFLGLSFWTATLIVFFAQIIGMLVQKHGQYLAIQIPISAALALVLGPTVGDYPLLRLLGALVGGLVGTIVSVLLSPPIYAFRTQDAVAELMVQVAGVIPKLADALAAHLSEAENHETYPAIRQVEQRLRATEQAYDLGIDSTRLNPWARDARHRLVDYPDMLLTLDRLVRQMRRIAYIINEPETMWPELAREQAWADDYAWLLKEIGAILVELAKYVSSSAPPKGSERLPKEALRARLEHARQHFHSWQVQATPLESLKENAENQPTSVDAHLTDRWAILTDLRHMLDEVRDLIDIATHPSLDKQPGT